MSEMKKPVVVKDSEFEQEVLNSEGPVLVDFWAEWCGPCHMIARVLEQLAGEYDGRLKIRKLNVDENSDSAARFGVLAIPTLILFKDGKPAETLVGAQTRAQLANVINRHLG